MDQIFVVKVIVKKYLEKNNTLSAALNDLGKTYDRKAMWDVRKIYGFGLVD